MGESKPHVVAIPSLAQGHLIPFLELAKLLASQGLRVSIITTPGNVKRLHQQVEGSNLDIRLVSLSFPPIDGVPPGIDNTDSAAADVVRLLMASSQKLAGPFEEWLEQQQQQMNSNDSQAAAANCCPRLAPVSCIISDWFTGWVHRSGAKFGVPIVVFQTCGAFGMSVFHSIYNHTPQKSVKRDDEYFEVPELPFAFKLRKSDMTAVFRDPESSSFWGFARKEINQSMEGRGILINTFYELDSLGIDHLRKLTGRPVWSIGPLLPRAVFDGTGIDRGNIINSRGKAADISEDECLQWLDSRRPQSVVFVCLGSHFLQSNMQIRALAAGLEASGQDFVWAIKCSPADTKSKGTDVGFPEGFVERTRERGLIIWGWAPQLLILSHPSVGAFLSHCGWNSTLESVSMGVPMITWPMFAEQPFNSMFLVERLGIGIQICLDVSGVPDEDEVKSAVRMVLAEEEGKKMRMRAGELRKLAKMAVDRDGSSHTDLQSFVQEMRQLHETIGAGSQ